MRLLHYLYIILHYFFIISALFLHYFTLSYIISSSQTAYVKNRFISERGRVISDILETSNSLALEGFLVTVDIEKTFDSVNHCFLLQILRKFKFGIDFVSWITTI